MTTGDRTGSIASGALGGTARRFIGWQTFFDFGDGQVKRNTELQKVKDILDRLQLAVLIHAEDGEARIHALIARS